MTDKAWAQELLEKIYIKEKVVAERNKGVIPYTTVEGRFDDWSDRLWWWTNGFYAGMQWRLYDIFEKDMGSESVFRKNARIIEEKMDGNLSEFRGMDHDNGFKWLLTAVADYKLTGNERSLNRGLNAAANLASRINLKAGLIRAWNDDFTGEKAGWAIIDCMMNLPLLYWASNTIKDSRFKQIAMLHADTAMKLFVRDNGSVNHIVTFNPETGEFIKSLGGQGLGEGSSWTRGQSWAVYGFAQSYLYTEKEEYLETAMKVADYYISCIPDNGHIPVDFCQPEDVKTEDSTSAAIAACGMLEIEKILRKKAAVQCGDDIKSSTEEKLKKTEKNYADKYHADENHADENHADKNHADKNHADKNYADKYHAAAMKLLRALACDRINLSPDVDHLVEKCTAAYHDKNHEYAIIYGDYYFVEALSKMI